MSSSRLSQTVMNENGVTLVAVLAIVTAVLLIGSALFILGTGEADIVDYTVDSARAFYLAEAGVERAHTYMNELAKQSSPSYPSHAEVGDQALGNGVYGVTVDQVTGACPWLREYEIVSTGEIDGVSSTVVSRIRKETFAQYLSYSDVASDLWFTTGDSLHGRVHSNGMIQIDGDPWFGEKVTSSQPTISIKEGSDPTFVNGYELGVDEVDFPHANTVKQTLQSAAESGGVCAGSLHGSKAYYDVELGRNGNDGAFSYRAYEKSGKNYVWSGWTDVDISTTNGVVWFDEPIEIQGTLDGQMTIGSAGDIRIVDDVTYAASSPGQGPDPDCDDMLGLVSAKDIIVADTTPNRNDCEIYAHMLALWKSFEVEDYNQGSPRGDLIIWGGAAQYSVGPVGTHNKWGPVSGYEKDYHYDTRLESSSPPSYPETNRYIRVAWREATSGD